MPLHEVWHVFVLLVTLFGAGAGAILLLVPLVFEAPPEGYSRARPYLAGLVGGAGLILVLEWATVH